MPEYNCLYSCVWIKGRHGEVISHLKLKDVFFVYTNYPWCGNYIYITIYIILYIYSDEIITR